MYFNSLRTWPPLVCMSGLCSVETQKWTNLEKFSSQYLLIPFTKIEVVDNFSNSNSCACLEKKKSTIFHFRVTGLPSEEEWPTEVTLSRSSFPSLSPCPITDFVPEINEKGAQLLLVGLCLVFRFKAFYPMCCWNLDTQQIVAGSSSMCDSHHSHYHSQRSELWL